MDSKEEKRAAAENILTIENWYSQLALIIEVHSIVAEDIYNMDETGFRIGQGQNEYVIVKEKNHKFSIGNASSCQIVSVIECIGCGSNMEAIPPVVILSGKCMTSNWFEHTEMPNNWLIIAEENGYTTDEATLHWLYHFEAFTWHRLRGTKHLLIMDNHGSHLTKEFIDFADKNGILLCPLSLRLTHLMQSLDLIPFQQYKLHHAQAVSFAAWQGVVEFDKQEFLAGLKEICEKAFTAAIIRAG